MCKLIEEPFDLGMQARVDMVTVEVGGMVDASDSGDESHSRYYCAADRRRTNHSYRLSRDKKEKDFPLATRRLLCRRKIL